jgi:pyroglutamyl-peptidase
VKALDRTPLVAGFEPFGGRSRNRSWEAGRRFGARRGVETVRLPVDFGRLRALVPDLARARRPLLLLGESPARQICVEQVALNVVDSDRPDNAGAKPQMESLVAGGPLALRVSWDAREVARALNRRGIAAAPSFHAGTYACNAALYLALHAAAGVPVGFLHVPHRRWPAGMRMSLLVAAIEIGLGALGAAAANLERAEMAGGE